MTPRTKWGIVALTAVVAAAGMGAVGVMAWASQRAAEQAPSEAAIAAHDLPGTPDQIVFRNTADGAGYGHVASVATAAPDGARVVGDEACDRIDAAAMTLSCLRIVRGIAPTYSATVHAADGTVLGSWALSGVPSRTRLSPSGELVATTVFVTGHSYATTGFSTQTSIHRRDGTDLGDLEEWTLLLDGAVAAPADRNFWGVTFVDDTSFYATVGMSLTGRTHLVRGDIPTRTLSALAENVECPSLSPDGSRIAFKRVTAGTAPAVHWTPAVYDLATGSVTLLAESRTIDDQIEWLDDDSVLYGMPRGDEPGDSDVWTLPADGSGSPRILIHHAWSPAVVRAGGTG